MTTTSEPLLRSLEFERGVTYQACKGVCDPSRLLEHAQTRSQTLSGEYVTDPMFIATGKDRRREAREELADCLNHLLFDSLEHIEDEERTYENLVAIRGIAAVYQRLEVE